MTPREMVISMAAVVRPSGKPSVCDIENGPFMVDLPMKRIEKDGDCSQLCKHLPEATSILGSARKKKTLILGVSGFGFTQWCHQEFALGRWRLLINQPIGKGQVRWRIWYKLGKDHVRQNVTTNSNPSNTSHTHPRNPTSADLIVHVGVPCARVYENTRGKMGGRDWLTF